MMMKTKNVRVREKDIRAGRIVYVSHPVFGVEKLEVASRPYRTETSKRIPSVGKFFDAKNKYGTNSRSVDDAGISPGNSYNYRRTFFKRKHAEEWANKMATDPGFISHHEQHLELCKSMDDTHYYL